MVNRKAALDHPNEKKRFSWAKKYKARSHEQWRQVLFSDQGLFLVLEVRSQLVQITEEEPLRVYHFDQAVKYHKENVLEVF